ncbi:hypothetical protein NMY22_g6328 [Coprinellus aureogranulatus]|nr:hypothetical protein NMY22_g6328 [Coprinellus aureogranulatus]
MSQLATGAVLLIWAAKRAAPIKLAACLPHPLAPRSPLDKEFSYPRICRSPSAVETFTVGPHTKRNAKEIYVYYSYTDACYNALAYTRPTLPHCDSLKDEE